MVYSVWILKHKINFIMEKDMFDLKEFAELAQELHHLERAVVILKANNVEVHPVLTEKINEKFDESLTQLAKAHNDGFSELEIAETIMSILQG